MGPVTKFSTIASSATALILCAHRWEAEPLLAAGEFRHLSESPVPFQLFHNRAGHLLLLTGQGPWNAAIGCAASLAHCSSEIVVANFGCAAALNRPIGETVILNRCSQFGSGKAIYPDRILKFTWPEASCATAERPLTRNDAGSSSKELFDMEAFGLLRAAEQFVPTAQMLVAKIVSDLLSDGIPKPVEVRAALADTYEPAAQLFYRMVEKMVTHLRDDPRRTQARQAHSWWQPLLEEVTGQVPFTLTQCRQLESRLKAFSLGSDETERQEKAKAVLELVRNSDSGNKKELKTLHSRLMEKLATPSLFSGGGL